MKSDDGGGRWSFGRLVRGLRTKLSKKLRLQHSVAELSSALADKELVFRAPELSAHLVEAVLKITPQFHLEQNEESRRVWELSQNGSCWGEFEALETLLRSLPRPRKVLEIGPGMGRSVVFLKRKLEWETVPFHLYEGNGPKQKYPLLARRRHDSFCGDLVALRQVLEHNEITDYEIFDAGEHGGRLDGLPGPYDLVYSFYGIGFHWSLEGFWPELRALMHERSVGIFTVPDTFEEFPALAEIATGYLSYRRILAKDRPLRLLVVSPESSAVDSFVDDRMRVAPAPVTPALDSGQPGA